MNAARRAAAVPLGLALIATACMDPGDFRCTEHAQCTIGGEAGFCEADGRCSVEDTRCPPSRRRYAHRAGEQSDACVPASCGGGGVEVSAGGGHACLIRGGSLWCWGRNDRGQLGDGTRTPRALPVRIAGVSGVHAVATGDAHTCVAQKPDAGGAVLCWGANDAGQVGDGGDMDRGLPQQVPGVLNVAALAAGKDFSCAAGADGSVRCWGDDTFGQIGDGGAAGPPRGPTAVAGLSEIRKLSAAGRHACAVTATGRLSCWGDNARGQIGDGTTDGPRPPTVILPATVVVDRVVTGREHTCALAGDDLSCWGNNEQGQVASPPSFAVPTPQAVTGATAADPIEVAAGAQHTCVVEGARNNVTCWGADDDGQLGTGLGIFSATTVAAGATFTCAVAADDAIFCWGDNHYGQLAVGGDTVRATPAQVPGLARAGALAAGGAHTCVTADGPGGVRSTYCFGSNGSGQLGTGSSSDDSTIGAVSQLQATLLAAGAAHSCATAEDEQLRCWGRGDENQLSTATGGDGVITTPRALDLAPPAGGDGVFAIATGAAHTCVAATISASLFCFGRNSDGQLGTGGVSPMSDGAVSVSLGTTTPLPRPAAVAAGDAHTCAVDDRGGVWCWGRGIDGQLGDGTGRERLSPTPVALGAGVPAAETIAAGAAHTCVLAGGRIFCWGRNAEGQVGAEMQVPIPAPVEVDGVSGARAIAAGGRHTCAIAADATVRCWGANESGQLGDGGTGSSNDPVEVAGLTGVDAIGAGAAHTCARRTDGTVWCWGANTSGQLGDGVTLASPNPLLARISCE